MRTVDVRSGEATEASLEVTTGGGIAGIVLAAGLPVARARIRAVLAPRTHDYPDGFVLHGLHVWRLDVPCENLPDNPQSHWITHTGADGRYAFAGLPPGTHRVEVVADGLSFDRRMDVPVRDGETTELRHTLSPAGVLQVAAKALGYAGVVPAGSDRPSMLAVSGHDVVTFPGLPAGRYAIARFQADESLPMHPLAEAVVEAGRTTWLDLRERSIEAVVTGTVRGGDSPIAGAEVRLHTETAHTAADGSFRLELGYRPSFGAGRGAALEVAHGGLVYEPLTAGGETGVQHFDLQLGAHALLVETVDAAGQPARAEVSLDMPERWSLPSGAIASGSVENGADGRARFAPLPAGRYRISAELASGVHLDAFADVPGTAHVVLAEPLTGVLEVSVRRAGRPAGAVSVWASTWHGNGPAPADLDAFRASSWHQNARSDAAGLVRLRVPAGEIVVVAHEIQPPVEPRRALVRAGETLALELTLP